MVKNRPHGWMKIEYRVVYKMDKNGRPGDPLKYLHFAHMLAQRNVFILMLLLREHDFVDRTAGVYWQPTIGELRH